MYRSGAFLYKLCRYVYLFCAAFLNTPENSGRDSKSLRDNGVADLTFSSKKSVSIAWASAVSALALDMVALCN